MKMKATADKELGVYFLSLLLGRDEIVIKYLVPKINVGVRTRAEDVVIDIFRKLSTPEQKIFSRLLVEKRERQLKKFLAVYFQPQLQKNPHFCRFAQELEAAAAVAIN